MMTIMMPSEKRGLYDDKNSSHSFPFLCPPLGRPLSGLDSSFLYLEKGMSPFRVRPSRLMIEPATISEKVGYERRMRAEMERRRRAFVKAFRKANPIKVKRKKKVKKRRKA